MGQGLFIIEASLSYSDTPQLVELLWRGISPSQRTLPTTHNTYNRKPSMSLGGFKPTIPASQRPQNHALDRVATGAHFYFGH
jgi:hypothetical protein